MLLLNVLDLPQVHRVVLPALAERLAQEEIWAQTIWPEGEEVLTDHILSNAGSMLTELEGERDRLLTSWRSI